MSDTTVIDASGMGRILHAIEESLKVSCRYQFSLWAQGALQGVVPHDVLLCARGDFAARRFEFDSFHRSENAEAIISRLIEPTNKLLHELIHAWLKAGQRPLLYSEGMAGGEDDPGVSRLRQLGGGHSIAHGAREVSSNEGSFFVFMQLPDVLDSKQAYLLELVMPHLHMALYRMLTAKRNTANPTNNIENTLSAREIEVLRWVGEGKTNLEIGMILDISPLTVKNHAQKIFRKLGVSNRAQAVSKGKSGQFSHADQAEGAHGAPTLE